jgi:hypothetical protein
VKLSKNIRQKKAKSLGGAASSELEVVCSWCGALIRSSSQADVEQMCLICHARMLNDYFQELRRQTAHKQSRAPKPGI